MITDDESRDGICILSFDNGGPGTYSQLLIIKEYMKRLAYDLEVDVNDVYPADYFDLMGGVGFGGLVALMLGHLRMNVNHAIDALVDVALGIFPDGPQQIPDPERNSKNLKRSVDGLFQARNIPLETKMYDRSRPPTRCKVALYAATKANITYPHIFRTYPFRGSSFNPTIVEAICATISIPSHFSPVTIGMRVEQRSFVGGPLGANNPTRELLREATTFFGDEKRVAQIISVGCGTPPIPPLEDVMNEDTVRRLLMAMTRDCDRVAQEVSLVFSALTAYHRFNVDSGVVDIGFNVYSGVGDIAFNDWSVLGYIEAHTGIYVAAATVENAMDDSLRCLQSRAGVAALGQLNRSTRVRVIARRAPAVVTNFILREELWVIMVHHLVALPSSMQIVFAITGMGGSGKTQMVSYFLQEYSYLFKQTVFVDAASAFSIKSDIQTWAQALGDGHEWDVWEDGFRILSNVPQGERWTLILDNADDPTLNLGPFIPKNSNLIVIITSRNPDVGNLSTTYHLELGEMKEDAALATLLRAARRRAPLDSEELESAKVIIKELGYLPLALVQAGSYCHQQSFLAHGVLQTYTFAQYLTSFRAHRAGTTKNPARPPLDSYQHRMYTTLDLSYQAIPQDGREFLHFLSYFHHADIPLPALAASARQGFADSKTYLERPASHLDTVSHLRSVLCPDGAWDEVHVHEMIRTLRFFDLVSTTSLDDYIFIQLHPLIQAWSRDMVSSLSQKYRAMVIQTLTSCSREAEPSLNRYLVPHILDTLDQVNMRDLHVNALVAAGEVLEDQAHYRKAAELIEEARDKVMSKAEASSETTLVLTAGLASLYRNEGRWNEAEKLELDVLEQRSRLLGIEHPDTIRAAANLASTYQSQGRLGEAEKLELDVLEQRSRLLGTEHPDTIKAAANLASTYQSQGRLDEAEKLELEVLYKRRIALGPQHLDTIRAMANLASTYRSQDRLHEAEQLGLEVLEQLRMVLGIQHPETIRAAANLASIYQSQGRLGEAEKHGVEVLEQCRKVLGVEHPDTIRMAAELTSIYQSQGRLSEAEKLGLDVLEQWRRLLGSEHPHTITAAVALALTYCEQGRWTDAQTLQLDALERMQLILGRGHPRTMAVAENLVATYNEQEEWEEAVKLQVDLLATKRRMLGEEHPTTISASAALASVYRFQGRLDAAEKLNLEVLYRSRVVMGENHSYTILASESLCATRSLRQESNLVRQLISTMFPHKDFVERKPRLIPYLAANVVEEPCMWYYETIPLSNATGDGSIVHKGVVILGDSSLSYKFAGHSYCLPLVPLNFQLSETSIVISENSTFSEISSQLYSVEESALPVALEQTGGPYPRWRIPKTTTKVSRGLQEIYVADISKPFTLALVRDVGGDIPLLIDMSSLKSVGMKTVGDVIGGALDARGHTWSSIKLLSDPRDIQGSSCSVVQEQTGGLYSTIFFVLMNGDPLAYNFRSDGECMGPLPLRIVFFQSQRLVDSAPRIKALTLPAIHLSRALHHLVLCLAEAVVMLKVEEIMGAYFVSRLNSLVSQLKATFQKLQDLVDTPGRAVRQSLIQFFYELCEEQPGVVAVRQSFESFKAFVLDGLGDTAESEYFPVNSEIFHEGGLEEDPLTQAETPGDLHGENDSTGSHDSSSSYDGDSTVESVEYIRPLEAADNGQEVDH